MIFVGILSILILSVKNRGLGGSLLNGQDPLSVTRGICLQSLSPVTWFGKLFWFWLNSFSCIFAYRCFHLFYSVMSTNTLTDAFRIPNLVVIFQFQYRCQLMDLILVISIFFLLLIFGFDLVHCCQFHILSMFHNFRKMQVQSLYRTI